MPRHHPNDPHYDDSDGGPDDYGYVDAFGIRWYFFKHIWWQLIVGLAVWYFLW